MFSLPYRRRIHNLVVHQRRSPLPCRRSILLRRSASLHRSRTAAPGCARGLALLRNRQRCLRGLSFIFFFLSGFSFFPCFSSFSSRHLVFVLKKIICWFFKLIFCENFEIAAVQKDANLVKLEKCCQTHIFLQKFFFFFGTKTRCLDENKEKHGKKENPERKRK